MTSSPPAARLQRRLVRLVIGACALVAQGAHAQDVGEVSLLIGEASVTRADGTRQPLQRGAAIRVGDRIETMANGHVHMRFIDKAAVSVRPDSTLEVQSYRYDKQRPELNEVRLRVDRGISRSISGAATEHDKTRFRLNTPIAAIGVRGTDFIVQTDAGGARATVNDGAIVVSAVGAACAGPEGCAGARELSADMGRLMAEVRVGDSGARLVPAADRVVASARRGEGRGSSQQLAMAEARALGLAAAEPTALESQRGNDRAAAGLLTLAAVQVPDLNRSPDLSGQLVWGRWAITPDGADKLSVPYALASLGRHITVADASGGLFRTNQTVPGQLFPDTLQGTVEFRLTRANATFQSGDDTQAATITASNLTVDFTRRTFATGLNLVSAGGVQGELRAAGGIRPDGIFTVRDNEQSVAGALSLDGKEAAYLFERSTAGSGLFRGKTLWGGP